MSLVHKKIKQLINQINMEIMIKLKENHKGL